MAPEKTFTWTDVATGASRSSSTTQWASVSDCGELQVVTSNPDDTVAKLETLDLEKARILSEVHSHWTKRQRDLSKALAPVRCDAMFFLCSLLGLEIVQ